MDQRQLDYYKAMKALRRFYAETEGNEEAVALHANRLERFTIPAPDNAGRILPERYEWVIEYESGFIHIDTTSYIECEILYRGHYAPQLVNIVKTLLSPGDVVISVGANIGCLTLPCAQAVGSSGKVIAFEPEPQCFERLQRNVMLNRLSNVSLHQLAISNKDSIQTLYLRPDEAANRAGATLQKAPGFEREVQIRTVRAESVEELRNLDRCDLIKIDTEGHDFVVLQQLGRIIERFHPHIIFEYEKRGWDLHGQSYDEATAFLRHLGYSLYVIGEEGIFPVSPQFPEGRDILCVPSALP